MLVIFAAAFGMLLAFAGLSLDGGFLYFERQRAQAAADAGAYSGALELKRGATAWITPSAKEDARLNGFDDTDADVTVTVNHPPVNGPRAGDTAFVEVIVESVAPTTLLKVVGRRTSTVAARAVAGVTADYSGPCILALNETANGSITISGTANLSAPTCDVMTRSVSNTAIVANGGGCINAQTIAYATGAGTTGGYTANGGNCLSPEPLAAIPPEDPYSSLTEPNKNDYPKQSNSKLQITGGTHTLNPGYYKGGIKITGGNVTLNPGMYVVDGFEVSGSGAQLSGDGVTIFNTGDGLKNIKISGGPSIELSATNDPSSPYNNMLFFNSSSSTCGTPCSGTIEGNALSTMEGVMYFPTVHLDYAGTEDQSAFSQIIADTIRFTGTAQVSVDWDAGAGRTPTATRVSFAE
jgi:hypothetical protein